jgi:hypothetical protein
MSQLDNNKRIIVPTMQVMPIEKPNSFLENMQAIGEKRVRNPLSVQDVFRARGGEDKRLYPGSIDVPAGFTQVYPQYDLSSMRQISKKEILPYYNFSFWKGYRLNPLNPEGKQRSTTIHELKRAAYFAYDEKEKKWERVAQREMPTSRKLGAYLEGVLDQVLNKKRMREGEDSILGQEAKRLKKEKEVFTQQDRSMAVESKMVQAAPSVLEQKAEGRQ